MNAPPCAGQWPLFDSTDAIDHAAARRICLTCPLIDACNERVSGMRSRQWFGDGTWAARLYRDGKRRYDLEALAIGAAEMDAARRLYAIGRRDLWVRLANGAYERTRKTKEQPA